MMFKNFLVFSMFKLNIHDVLQVVEHLSVSGPISKIGGKKNSSIFEYMLHV
jgi:hypothetical protein